MPFNPLRTHMAGTQWYMCHGERKLSTDANDGAAVDIGNWKPNYQYLLVGYFAATPAGLPEWDNSFFIACATCSGYTGGIPAGARSYILFDHGGGEMISNTALSMMLFPGAEWVPGCTDQIYGIPAVPGVFNFGVNFRADGKVYKQWAGNAGGDDWYLLIAEKSI